MTGLGVWQLFAYLTDRYLEEAFEAEDLEAQPHLLTCAMAEHGPSYPCTCDAPMQATEDRSARADMVQQLAVKWERASVMAAEGIASTDVVWDERWIRGVLAGLLFPYRRRADFPRGILTKQ